MTRSMATFSIRMTSARTAGRQAKREIAWSLSRQGSESAVRAKQNLETGCACGFIQNSYAATKAI
jgi:hypothetical protein